MYTAADLKYHIEKGMTYESAEKKNRRTASITIYYSAAQFLSVPPVRSACFVVFLAISDHYIIVPGAPPARPESRRRRCRRRSFRR